jgi:hypothetical protein
MAGAGLPAVPGAKSSRGPALVSFANGPNGLVAGTARQE